ncbi:MAG: hypothetical protein Tsb0034_13170 [Ekhidna sp.]
MVSINDYIKSDYGTGRVIVITKQWIIHDNSVEGKFDEFALLIGEDHFEVIPEKYPNRIENQKSPRFL